MRNVVELVPLSDLEPAAYNPREADPQRLRLLTTSLTKLGFILPIYATPDGHLLSGHQRLSVATALGCKRVPVVRMDVPADKVRNVNLVFNRSTNDMRRSDTSDTIWGNLSMSELAELLARVPDKEPDTPEFYRCMQTEEVALGELSQRVFSYEAAGAEMCMKLLKRGIVMPAVISASGDVVNGNFRVMAAGEYTRWGGLGGTYPCVRVSDDEAEIARRLLNLISMRFTVENQYADQLRYGSYRRPSNVVPDLVPSLRCWADGKRWRAAHETFRNPKRFWSNFRREYGESILDFGAGQRRNEAFLEAKGIPCLSWEPYPVDWRCEAQEKGEEANLGAPSLALSRQLTDTFLEEVANGRKFTAITCSAVLNSVPFHFDRMCVLSIVHALCQIDTAFVGSVRSTKTKDKMMVKEKNRVSTHNEGQIQAAMSVFMLDYEPNIVLGDINSNPKVQKFHTPEELTAQLKVFWEKVELIDGAGYIGFRASAPKRRNLAALKTALLHEFDLPYPEGQSIGRGEAALAAFGKRLGVDFSKVEGAPKPGGG